MNRTQKHGQHIGGDPGDRRFSLRTPLRVTSPKTWAIGFVLSNPVWRTCREDIVGFEAHNQTYIYSKGNTEIRATLLQITINNNTSKTNQHGSKGSIDDHNLSNCNHSNKTTYKWNQIWTWVKSKTSGPSNVTKPSNLTNFHFHHPHLVASSPHSSDQVKSYQSNTRVWLWITLPSKLIKHVPKQRIAFSETIHQGLASIPCSNQTWLKTPPFTNPIQTSIYRYL